MQPVVLVRTSSAAAATPFPALCAVCFTASAACFACSAVCSTSGLQRAVVCSAERSALQCTGCNAG